MAHSCCHIPALLAATILPFIAGPTASALSGQESTADSDSDDLAKRDPLVKSTATLESNITNQQWEERIRRASVSRNRKWRRRELRRVVAELSVLTSTAADPDTIGLLKSLELAQWSLNAKKDAKDTCARRLMILKSTVPPKELASLFTSEGRRYSKMGFADAACESYHQVAKLIPGTNQAANVERDIGRILRRVRRFQDAENYCLDIARKYRLSHPDIARQCHYIAADSAWRASKMQRAQELFSEIQQEYPGTPEADDAGHMMGDIAEGEVPPSG